jgi:hypothetical protein
VVDLVCSKPLPQETMSGAIPAVPGNTVASNPLSLPFEPKSPTTDRKSLGGNLRYLACLAVFANAAPFQTVSLATQSHRLSEAYEFTKRSEDPPFRIASILMQPHSFLPTLGWSPPFRRNLEVARLVLLLIIYWRTHLPPPPPGSSAASHRQRDFHCWRRKVDTEQTFHSYTDSDGEYLFNLPSPPPKYIHLVMPKQRCREENP